MTACREEVALSRGDQVGDHLALGGLHNGPGRHGDDEVGGTRAVLVAALPRVAGAGTPVGVVVEVEQAVHALVDDEDDIPTPAAVPTVGATERLELLTVDRCAPIAAVTALGMDQDAVDETGHRATGLRRRC